jgi:hypothetical protein
MVTNINSVADPDRIAACPVALPIRQVRTCPHPGELALRVMCTHPRSVDAGSTAGERKVIENGGVSTTRDAPRRWCDGNHLTGEIRNRPTLYRPEMGP